VPQGVRLLSGPAVPSAMPYHGNRRKKRKTGGDTEVSEREKKNTPRCFVLRRGVVGDRVKRLVQDFRDVMSPNAAVKLKETRLNRIEDFIAVAGHFHVTHLVLFTCTKLNTWMKIVKIPHGPTLTFKVNSFSLIADIRAQQKKPAHGPKDLLYAPLQVLHGFGKKGDDGKKAQIVQLTSDMLRGLFPPVDVPTFNQAHCRRVVFFGHEGGEQDTVQFRHFSIQRRATGLQRGVTKLMSTGKIPSMGRYGDVADFVLGGGGATESEFEGGEEVPNMHWYKKGRVAIRLRECGPRLQLQLIKAQEGVLSGNVLYHRWTTKTPSQIQVLQEKARQKEKLKERNAKIEGEYHKLQADKLEAKKRRREERLAEKFGDGEDAGGENGKEDQKGGVKDVGASGKDSAPPTKKQRFNPFSHKKVGARKKAVAGGGDQDAAVSGGGKGSAGKDGQDSGTGKGGHKGGSKGGSKGGGKGGRKGGRAGKKEKRLPTKERVLEAFKSRSGSATGKGKR